MRLFILAAVIAGISGCAPTAPKPAAPVAYRCEDGRQFTLDVAPAGDAATINISGMSFQLFREPAAKGTRFACSVLTVSHDGDVADVQMEDAPFFRNCRSIRP